MINIVQFSFFIFTASPVVRNFTYFVLDGHISVTCYENLRCFVWLSGTEEKEGEKGEDTEDGDEDEEMEGEEGDESQEDADKEGEVCVIY